MADTNNAAGNAPTTGGGSVPSNTTSAPSNNPGTQTQQTSAQPNQGPATPQAGKFAAGTVTPQAGNSEASTPSSQAQATDKMDNLSLEDALEALKKERAEAARYRKKAQEYDALLAEQENAKLSETERLQKQLADYQQQIEALNLAKQEIALRARVESVAASLGLKPELALRIIDQNAVAFDDNGFPTNISDLLERAMQDYGLAPTTPTGASAAPQAAPNTSPAVAAAQPGRFAPPAGAPAAPQTGATNPPRSGGMAAANGVFGPGERPRLNDRRLWSGPHNPNTNPQRRG